MGLSASPGDIEIPSARSFSLTHYPPLGLVLKVNFGNRWNELRFQEHLLILCAHEHTQIVIICTQMKFPKPGSALRYSFATSC